MILSTLIATQVVAMPRLIEFPSKATEVVAIEALIKLPKLEPGHRFRLDQAAINAVKMTPQYGRRDIARILAPGYRFRVDQLADVLRIGLTVEPKDLGAGLSVLSSVLTQPTFLQDAIKVDSIATISPWQRAIKAYETVPMDVDQALLQDIWKYVVQPKNITVGVRGRFTDGQALSLWKQREQYWVDYVPNKLIYGRSPKLRLDVGQPPILLMRAAVGSLTPDDLVAATLLGGGKDSILWQLCREELRMSYQQDSFFLPTESGWEFRVAVATDQRILEEGAVATLQSKLLTAVDKLTEQDLDHARGLLRGYLEFGQPGIPIILGLAGITSSDPNETLFRDLYFAHKNLPAFVSSNWIPETNLKTVKARLRSLLEGSNVSFK